MFYDTDAVVLFFEKDENDENDYNPLNIDTVPKISLYVVEELLHKCLDKKLYERWGYDDFIDFWENFEEYKSFFRVVDITQRELTQKFYIVFNSLMKETNIVENYGKNNLPGGKDIMNICSADTSNCKALITCDTDYRVFKKISGEFDKLERIIILNRTSGEVKKKISL